MGGITRAAAVRLAELRKLRHAHPELDFDEFAGNYYAWKPAPGDKWSGETSHGRTADERLAKLGG
jgi:hypothetical protein